MTQRDNSQTRSTRFSSPILCFDPRSFLAETSHLSRRSIGELRGPPYCSLHGSVFLIRREALDVALILIIDDDSYVRSSLENLLASVGYETAGFDSAEALLETNPIATGDCAILDVRMKDMTGLGLQQALCAQAWTTPIIFLTAYCDEETRARAMKGGAFAFLCKPFDEEELLGSIEAAVALARD